MIKRLKLVIVNTDYCDYLRKFDKKVPYNFSKKENRPFVGVLFKIDDVEYFAPLSSPKEKHLKMSNSIDFLKIDNGKLGAVNFNNMIPITKNNYKKVILNKKFDNEDLDKYRILLDNQLAWLNAHYIQLRNKSKKLYKNYVKGKLNKKIKERCCNFKLLEEKCKEYNENIVASS